MLSVWVKNIFLYVLDVLTQIYFRLIRNLCIFAIKMAKELRLGIKNKRVYFVLLLTFRTFAALIGFYIMKRILLIEHI